MVFLGKVEENCVFIRFPCSLFISWRYVMVSQLFRVAGRLFLYVLCLHWPLGRAWLRGGRGLNDVAFKVWKLRRSWWDSTLEGTMSPLGVKDLQIFRLHWGGAQDWLTRLVFVLLYHVGTARLASLTRFCWWEPLRDARFKCKYSDGLLIEMQAFWKTVWNSDACIDESLLVQGEVFDVFSHDKLVNLCLIDIVPCRSSGRCGSRRTCIRRPRPFTRCQTSSSMASSRRPRGKFWDGGTLVNHDPNCTVTQQTYPQDEKRFNALWCVKCNAVWHRAGWNSVLPWFQNTVWQCLTVSNCAPYRIIWFLFDQVPHGAEPFWTMK